jgi:hypothetical protein
MTEVSFDEAAIEGYFEHSRSNEGNYSIAGNANNHHVQTRISDGHRLFFSALDKGEEELDINWDSRGIKCFISGHQIRGERRVIVECSDERFFSMMNRLITNILQQNIIGAENIISLFKSERLFWSGVPNLMTQEKAVGLFGELFILWKWLPDQIVEIIQNDWWNGPTGSDKDFNFNDLQIEVKTTMTNSSPIQHIVSTLNQLQSDGLPLVLFSLVAHPDEGGSHSLCQLVDQISNILSDHSDELKDDFIDLLGENDFIVGHPEMEQYKFSLPQENGLFFAVGDQFPRLTSNDDSNDERIHIESYKITLNQIGHLRLDLSMPTNFEDIILKHNNVLNASI